MIMAFSITLLPDPVEPAISKCGIVSSAATLMRPLMSLPKRDGQLRRRLRGTRPIPESARRLITSRLVFGTSMPTVGLPGMRSISTDSACKPRHRSSVKRSDAAILHARFGLELERGHHRTGVDLHHRAAHVEFFELRLDAARRLPSVPGCRNRCPAVPRSTVRWRASDTRSLRSFGWGLGGVAGVSAQGHDLEGRPRRRGGSTTGWYSRACGSESRHRLPSSSSGGSGSRSKGG